MARILIVDDEQKIRNIYRRFLEGEGYHVSEASNAKEATDLLIVMEVDLVLLDLNMPEVNGEQMMDIVKVYDTHFKVMVVSVCPLDEQKRRLPCADGYFDKSHSIDILLRKIRNILESLPHVKNTYH